MNEEKEIRRKDNMEKIIEKRLIKEYHHSELVDISELAKLIADDIKSEWKVIARGELKRQKLFNDEMGVTSTENSRSFWTPLDSIFNEDLYKKYSGKEIEIAVREI